MPSLVGCGWGVSITNITFGNCLLRRRVSGADSHVLTEFGHDFYHGLISHQFAWAIAKRGKPGHVSVTPRWSGVMTRIVGLHAVALASVCGVTVSACRWAGAP